MKTFDDLSFETRPDTNGEAKQAIMFFPNGYGVSVLFGRSYYSNGLDTYELAVIYRFYAMYLIAYNTGITTDGVLANLTKDEVTEAMIKVQKLKPIYE